MPSAAAKAAHAAMKRSDGGEYMAGGKRGGGGPLGGASVGLLLGTAEDVVGKMSTETKCFDLEREGLFPHLDWAEIQLGRVLGRGGFCVVNEIKKISLSEDGLGHSLDNDVESSKDEAFHRAYLEERCVRNGDSRYAIKALHENCTSDAGLFLKGTVDLAVEAKFLSVLEHPNIIKMRAVSSTGHFRPKNFLILDRLYDTLEVRMRKWGRSHKKANSVIGKFTGMAKKKTLLTVQRLHVAHDLAAALNYMHGHRIVYRDLKPENCGFDIRDDVKIFDLGLAKELNDNKKNKDGTYNMTGFTGSLRYMAPEVARNKPYDLSVDVYSFGILFWQIMELEPPFVTYSCQMHRDLVVDQGYRPAVDKAWPKSWGDLMRSCWSADRSVRPGFQHVLDVISEESHRLSPSVRAKAGGNNELDLSRRSYALDLARKDRSKRTATNQ